MCTAKVCLQLKCTCISEWDNLKLAIAANLQKYFKLHVLRLVLETCLYIVLVELNLYGLIHGLLHVLPPTELHLQVQNYLDLN